MTKQDDNEAAMIASILPGLSATRFDLSLSDGNFLTLSHSKKHPRRRGVARMNRFVRRGLLGALAGLAASAPLLFLSTANRTGIAVALAAGSIYSGCVPSGQVSYADNIMGAAALGIPVWGITSIVLLPLISGNHIALGAAEMRGQFASLVGWILYGALMGAVLRCFNQITEALYGVEAEPAASPATNLTRIVILGGGFGGMKVAECLEQELAGSVSRSALSNISMTWLRIRIASSRLLKSKATFSTFLRPR